MPGGLLGLIGGITEEVGDTLDDLLDGSIDSVIAGITGDIGLHVAYVERLSDSQRWLVSVSLGVNGNFPVAVDNYIDLQDDNQADICVRVKVSFSTSTGSIDRAEISIERQHNQRLLEPFRLVLRADGGAIWPASGDDALDELPFIFLGMESASGLVDVPDLIDITVVPKGLGAEQPQDGVVREAATDIWPLDSGAGKGTQFDVTVKVDGGDAPTGLVAGMVTGGKAHNASEDGDLQFASLLPGLGLPSNILSTIQGEAAVVAKADADAAAFIHGTLWLSEADIAATATDLEVGVKLWQELLADEDAAITDAELALELNPDKPMNLSLAMLIRDGLEQTNVSVDLSEVPTNLNLRALPSRQDIAPGTVGADGQDAWIGYHANSALGYVDVDFSPPDGTPMWLRAEQFPLRLGFNLAGAIEEAFSVRLGDPDNLNSPLASGIGKLGLERGQEREGPPGTSLEVKHIGADETLRLTVPGLQYVNLQMDTPPSSDDPLQRWISAAYQLQGAPQNLDGTIALSSIDGTLEGIPHEVEVLLDPANRVPDFDATQSWISYRADRVFHHIEINITGTFWLWLDDLPDRVGLNLVGEDLAQQAFSLRLGDPDNLEQPLPAGIGRVGLALGEGRGNTPDSDYRLEVLIDESDDLTRVIMPGLQHVYADLAAPANADTELLDRESSAGFRLQGAPSPLNGFVSINVVEGFSGEIDIESLPQRIDVAHTPSSSGNYKVTLDLHDQRLGRVDAALVHGGDANYASYDHINARLRALSSFAAQWQQSAEGLQSASLGSLNDIDALIAGGIGEVGVALAVGAPPPLTAVPELRFELVDLAQEQRLLIGAAGLGLAHFNQSAAGQSDQINLEVKRAIPAYTVDADEAAAWQDEFSAAVLIETKADNADANRLLIHAGHIQDSLAVAFSPGSSNTQIETRGRLERLKVLFLDKPRHNERKWNAQELRAELSVPSVPQELSVNLGDDIISLNPSAAMTVNASLQIPGDGGGDEPPEVRQVNALLALPGRQTRLDLSKEGAIQVGIDQQAKHGITGRIALSRELNTLSAVRATPQVYIHSDTDESGAGTLHAMSARIYGLRELSLTSEEVNGRKVPDIDAVKVNSGLFSEKVEVLGVDVKPAQGRHRQASGQDIKLWLDADRVNTSMRIAAFGADAPDTTPRRQLSIRLSELTPRLDFVSKPGEMAWQSLLEIRSQEGPIAKEGDIFGEPAQIPWDGPRAGEHIGNGLLEARLLELPKALRLVSLPFENAANSDGISGFLSTPEAWHAGGIMLELEGSLRIAELLSMGWSRSGTGDEAGDHSWSRLDAQCLNVITEEKGQLWLRVLQQRFLNELDGGEPPKLNLLVDTSLKVFMSAEIYDKTKSSSSPELTHWPAFNGEWQAAAKLQLKDFNGWLQIEAAASPITEMVESGLWWVRVVAALKNLGDVSLGNTSGVFTQSSPIDNPCKVD